MKVLEVPISNNSLASAALSGIGSEGNKMTNLIENLDKKITVKRLHNI